MVCGANPGSCGISNKKKQQSEKCECGGELITSEAMKINPGTVFTDHFWAWSGKDIKLVCSKCGAHILKEKRYGPSAEEDYKHSQPKKVID